MFTNIFTKSVSEYSVVASGARKSQANIIFSFYNLKVVYVFSLSLFFKSATDPYY